MDILDGPNMLGHHLHFAAEAAPNDWMQPDNRTRGKGLWDNSAKTLTLYLAKDTECATEYVFSFQVVNAKVSQIEPDIKIEATWPGNSKQIFESNQESALRISPKSMTHDVTTDLSLPYATQGDAAALKIWAMEFKSSALSQSSNYPCDNNTITVSFATNIPLLKTPLCEPKITLEGLNNAIAPTGTIEITDVVAGTVAKFTHSNVWGNFSMVEARWNNQHADPSTKALSLDVMASTTAASVYSFSFIVANPAGAQSCPSTSITGSGCGDVCDVQARNVIRNSVAYDIVGCSSSVGRGIVAIMTPAVASACALQVQQFRFHRILVKQSSPFPCDNNTISVAFSANVPIFKECAPRLTLTGFQSVVWPPAGHMNLSDVDGTGSVGEGIGFGPSASWGGGTGSGALSGTLALSGTETTLNKDQFYNFSFLVTNPRSHQVRQDIGYTFHLSSSGSGELDQMNIPLSGPTLLEIVDSSSEPVISGRSQTNVGYRVEDSHPLFVRKPTLLVKNISQSTANPCANNTISVAIASNVPLLTTQFANCKPLIQITGLTTTATFADYLQIINQADGSSSSGVINAYGKWDRSTGSLELNLTGTLIAGSTYTMDFVVTNPAKGQPSPPVGISLWEETQVSMNRYPSPPLLVHHASIANATVSQSSDVPCDDSTISINIHLAVDLLARCSPTLTIDGLTNSRSTVLSTYTDTNNLWALASWNRMNGVLALNTSQDIPAGQYTISFILQNPNFGQSKRVLTASGHIFNQVPSSVSSPSLGTELNPSRFVRSVLSHDAPLRVSSLALTSRIGQSSPYPCHVNTITVTIHSNLPIKTVCQPVITVSNLAGAHSSDGMHQLIATPGGTASSDKYRAFGNWSSQSRSFELAIDNDMNANQSYIFSFPVSNPRDHQASPNVRIGLSGIYPLSDLTPIFQAMVKDESNVAGSVSGSYNPGYLNNNSSCPQTVCEEGSAAPLHVRKFAIETGQADVHHTSSSAQQSTAFLYPARTVASQSSWYPCELNTITVTLSTSVALLASCSPTITIKGFMDTETSDGVVPVHSTGPFNATGIWTQSIGQLVLGVDENLAAGQQYVFSFRVNNTKQHQDPTTLLIKACIQGQSCSAENGFASMQADNTNGVRSMPMAVKDIYFVKREVNQSNPLPCAQNSITVLLAISAPLHLSCGHLNLTLAGLTRTHADMVDNDHFPVTDCSSLQPLLSSHGVWSKNSGSLKLALIRDMLHQQEYCFRFTVKNPSAATATASLITVDIARVLPTSTISYQNTVLTESAANHSRDLIDTSPVAGTLLCANRSHPKIGVIPTSTFVVKTGRQNNPFPCHQNEITFVLQPDVKLLAGTRLTISGLKSSTISARSSVDTLTDSDPRMTLTGASASVFGSLGPSCVPDAFGFAHSWN